VAGRTAAALALSAVAVTATALSVSAQSLARLTVQSFVLSTDNPRPRLDVPFHLIVTLHVRERVTQIANLELPMLADLELLGDERETVSGTNGTQYRETITVVAHRAGPIAIAPATLQAIDARDGMKPVRDSASSGWLFACCSGFWASRVSSRSSRCSCGVAHDAPDLPLLRCLSRRRHRFNDRRASKLPTR
jgi:hypothetical protein